MSSGGRGVQCAEGGRRLDCHGTRGEQGTQREGKGNDVETLRSVSF